MKIKRMLAIGLVTALTLVPLTGCSKEEGPQGGGEEPSQSGEVNQDDGEKVSLKWYVASSTGPQADIETIEEAINEYTKETYGMNLDLKILMNDFASNDQKMQMVISSGEEFDIAWTSTWNNNFYDNVNKNAFLELDELLDNYAPELKASMSEEIWNSVKIKGDIYAIPNQQMYAKHNFVSVVKEYADKYNLDMDSVHSLADLDEFFNQVKADYPDKYPFAASSNGILSKSMFANDFEMLIGGDLPGAIRLGDESLTVVNQYELDTVKDHYKLMDKWVDDGIIQKDAATITDNALAGMKSGKHIAAVDATFKPGVEEIVAKNFNDQEMVFATISEPWISTDGILSTLNSVSRTSKKPEEAVKFLNYVNTDPVIYNYLCFGIEGTHYTKNDDGTVTVIENSGYTPNADWVFGNQFNAYVREGQDAKVWEETEVINVSANKSPALGFAFDSTEIASEIAGVSAVIDQYKLSLDTGVADPETILPEFLAKMKSAGSDRIMEELQTQINEWKATK